MCKYCDNTGYGNANECLTEVNLHATGGYHAAFLFGSMSFIDSDETGVYLKEEITNGNSVVLAKSKVKIQYCPVCGRKF